MPTYASSQEWLHLSTQLLEARPATTRITARYAIKPAPARRRAGRKDKKDDDDVIDDAEQLPDAPPARPPRGRLVLKTYDHASGACLKYKTTKAAEVSRLVQILGGLGRQMAALPPRDEGAAASAVPPEEPAAGEAGGAGGSGSVLAQGQGQQPPQQQPGGGGGGKGKKKKGKR